MKMDLSKTLGLIEDALREVPSLRKLHYNNAEYDLWLYKVADILKAGFGAESDEYKRFTESVKPEKRTGTQWQLQTWYDRRLTKRAAALLSIIRKYELLGKEAIHPEVVEPQKSFAIRGEKTPKGKIGQLKQFLRELEKFRQLQIAAGDERLDPELNKLRTKLVRESAQMKELLLPQGGQLILTQFNEDFDAFDTAFTEPIYPWGIATQWHAAVNSLIQKTNEVIGKLEMMSPSDALREVVYSGGTPYEAYKGIREIISLATKKLTLVDPYVDGTVVTLLENVQPSVKIQVLTRKVRGDFQLAAQKFKQQRETAGQGSLEVRQDKGDFHDRFIVADDNFFHLGASIKDAGTKVCAINEIEDSHNKSVPGENIRKAWDVAAKVL
jgi:hypothetical protein